MVVFRQGSIKKKREKHSFRTHKHAESEVDHLYGHRKHKLCKMFNEHILGGIIGINLHAEYVRVYIS